MDLPDLQRNQVEGMRVGQSLLSVIASLPDAVESCAAPSRMEEGRSHLLTAWREENQTAPTDALIFPTTRNTPMRPENRLHRRVHPIAKALSITVPINFQILRPTFATNAQGGNPKDVQAHLRHAAIGTTMNLYTQAIPRECDGWSTL